MKLSEMLKKTSRKTRMALSETQKKEVQKVGRKKTEKEAVSPEIPEGLWKKCNACKAPIMAEDVRNGAYICPKCGHYFRMHAMDRIEMLAEKNTFEEWDRGLNSGNPMQFRGYEEKVQFLREKTKLDEAVVTGRCKIKGNETVLAVMDGRFLMASMGNVVGEKLTRAIERATKEQLPVIIFSCSGGARMQEGIHSLMQMAKVSAALKKHHDAGLLYISVLTDPTTGGVTASFAMLGDLILAEPNALVGFAGPRVIEQTIGGKLPDGFQRAEFLLEHGFVDKIVKREEMKETLSQILRLHKKKQFMTVAEENNMYATILEEEKTPQFVTQKEEETPQLVAQKEAGNVQVAVPFLGNQSAVASDEKTAWDRVLLSRKKERPVGWDYIETLFPDFIEFHGDRYCKDDPAIVGGIASFHGTAVTVIAQAKGKSTKENIARNYGMPSPDGYRKALRLMKQAEKFGRPILCLVDTPGAFCGIEAEERGQGEAIARNLFEMAGLKVPILSIIIGEGGSGGALAMAVADEVCMLENAVYSILSPEGFASILWKDSKRAEEAAGVMKLTSYDLKMAGIIEHIFPEPEKFTKETKESVSLAMEEYFKNFLERCKNMDTEELLKKRYQRFRKM